MKQRFSNIELLRIFSMLTIVLTHFASRGVLRVDGLLDGTQPGLIMDHGVLVAFFTRVLTVKFGVDLFVLISGFFMIKSTMKIKSLRKLFIQVSSTGLITLAIAIGFGYNWNWFDIWHAFAVLFYGDYWLPSAYVLLYMMSGLINDLLRTFDKKKYQQVILFGTVLLFVIPTLTQATGMTNDILRFMIMYTIGAYLRTEAGAISRLKSAGIFSFGLFGTTALGVYALVMANYGNMSYYRNFVISADANIFTLIMAFGAFTFVQTIKVGSDNHSALINSTARLMFGVYLFSESPFLHEKIWQDWLHVQDVIGTGYLNTIKTEIIDVLIVFIVAMAAEKVRQVIFKLLHIR